MKGMPFDLEDLYVALSYSGPKFLTFINDLHVLVMLLFLGAADGNLQNYENLNLTRTSLFSLLHHSMLKEKLTESVAQVCWPVLLAEQLRVLRSGQNFSADESEVVTILEMLNVNEYNQLLLAKKIKILILLINSCMELPVIRETHQKINDKVLRLTKEKVTLEGRLRTTRKVLKENFEKLKALRDSIIKLNSDDANMAQALADK